MKLQLLINPVDVLAALLFAVFVCAFLRGVSFAGFTKGPSAFFSASLKALFWFILVAASDPRIWPKAASGYPGDSIYTLATASGLGLLLVSTILISMVLLIGDRVEESVRQKIASDTWLLPLRLFAAALLLFILFAVSYLLSPQIYYLYHFVVLGDLPMQWAGRPLSDLGNLRDLLFLKPGMPLSEDAAAMTLHALLLLPFRMPPARSWIGIVLTILILALARYFLILLGRFSP
ncbi:MAG: hypothetical protein R3245_09990 [Kiloniellales bacterium]|nr:hypothetical protein [Kiloniellales bacterium]